MKRGQTDHSRDLDPEPGTQKRKPVPGQPKPTTQDTIIAGFMITLTRRCSMTRMSRGLAPGRSIGMIDKQPWQVEQPDHPGNHRNDVQHLEPVIKPARLEPPPESRQPTTTAIDIGLATGLAAFAGAGCRVRRSPACRTPDAIHQPGYIFRIGLRRDPMAKVEDQRPIAKRLEHPSTPSSSAAPPATTRSGSRLPCTAPPLWILPRKTWTAPSSPDQHN
jgi:hypothetical protein